ncbi:hypothetical protein U9M48_025701 [Paspalum notatum var. saurae]|uniref:Homeobox domain-containing protein n=1 Tax=Paspalum notatum var. saurae TaxID=547442 RepID=A0AAQ3WY73_PASNO
MSSLTTTGSAEERYAVVSVEELGAHLSLGIGRTPAPQGRPRTVQLFGEVLSLMHEPGQDDGRARPTVPAAGRKKRDGGATSTVAAGIRQGKKAKTTSDDGDGGGGGGRNKKLRLTAEQARMLEDSFRAHNILSHAEKHELARRVGLSARQVEVWFQNRRARTKLKQTEVDCELLRRWCDRLADENARLRGDLAELRASTRLAVCAACCGKQLAVAAAATAGNMMA